MDLATQVDFDLAAAAVDDRPFSPRLQDDVRRKRILAPFPLFLSRAVGSLHDALITTTPSAVIAAVSHVSATTEIGTKSGKRVFRTTLMLNDSSARNLPMVVWGDVGQLFPTPLNTGDIIALSAVVPSEFRGTKQLKYLYHCRASVLYRCDTPLTEPPPSDAISLIHSLSRLVEWSRSELSYLWRLCGPGAVRRELAPDPPSIVRSHVVLQASDIVSSASSLLDWPPGVTLPALRCQVVSLQQSTGNDALYRVGGHAFRRWQAVLVPADSPGVTVLCLLWHFIDDQSMANSGARGVFEHLRTGLEGAMKRGVSVDITACRCTHSAVFDCRVLNNTPHTEVRPVLATHEALVMDPVRNAGCISLATESFAARKSIVSMRGSVVALFWPRARLRACGSRSGPLIDALSAQRLIPWACATCAADTDFARVSTCRTSFDGSEPSAICAHSHACASNGFSQTAATLRTSACLPDSWPFISPTPASLRKLLRLQCPSCLSAVNMLDGVGVARCPICVNPIDSLRPGRQHEGMISEICPKPVIDWGGPAPKPPEWVFEHLTILLNGSIDTQNVDAPLRLWWVNVKDDDLLTHIMGGISADLAIGLITTRQQNADLPMPRDSHASASSVWFVEQAIIALSNALCDTLVKAQVIVQKNPDRANDSGQRPGTAILVSTLDPI